MSTRLLVVATHEAEADLLRNAIAYYSIAIGAHSVAWAATLYEAQRALANLSADLLIVDSALLAAGSALAFGAIRSAHPRMPVMTLHDDEPGLPQHEDNDDEAGLSQHAVHGHLVKGAYGSSLLPQAIFSLINASQAEARLALQRARAELTLAAIADAVVTTGADGCIDYLNDAARNISGWLADDAIGRPVREVLRLLCKDSHAPIKNPLDTVIEQDTAIEQDTVLRLPAGTILLRRDGSECAIADSSSPIYGPDGRLEGAVIVFHDISAAQELVRRVAHLSTHDFLTSLPNRAMLHERIGQAVAHATRQSESFVLMVLDLDNFKRINESLGHAVGDRLLCCVAERLRAGVRVSDVVSRQGGDEFVVLMPAHQWLHQAAMAAEKLLAVLTAPHQVDQHELHVSASIGISIFPQDGGDADTLLQNADAAMYLAKEKGRNNYQFYAQAMNARAVERQLIETHLRHALDRNEFVLHYQPKINLASGAVIGAEALLRWMHPAWGMVAPDRFIGVAEDYGLIVPIGRWVLREACRQARLWQDEGMPIASIAVNVSAAEFMRPDFVAGVRQIMDDTALAPHCLELEITESVLMHDARASRAILSQLKDMGIRLAVDDFGTGPSSLSYLKLFPIDVLKIDRSFVSGIGADDDGSIARAVIAMGNSLHYKVVAEGVEDQYQLDFLRGLDCAEGQGFFFSRPLAPAAFALALDPAPGLTRPASASASAQG